MLTGLLLAMLGALGAAAPLNPLARTMRVDYVHGGTSNEERCYFDAARLEGPWPGPIGDSGSGAELGAYVFEVLDAQSGQPRFVGSFASVFGEWQTTPEARTRARAFHESLRFPVPPAAVDVILKKRDRKRALAEIWRVRVDPLEASTDRAAPAPHPPVTALIQNGAPQDKLDLLLLGDGYTAAEMDKFHRDAWRLAGVLFGASPFKERRSDFNVWALAGEAQENGISHPADGVYRRSPLGATYDALGMERYVLTLDNRRLRDLAAAAPYDVLVILVNERRYGGGGVYGLYATVAVDNAWAPYIFVHELGHTLAGLADEYFSSAVSYAAPTEPTEPWEPNVSADPRGTRWLDLVRADTPLPTPWPKLEYEALVAAIQERRKLIRAQKRPEAEMEALFDEERAQTSALLSRAPFARRVGAFEGAMYAARGLYRPEIDCVMFSRNALAFCAVCRRAIERAIDLHLPASDRRRR